MRERWFNEVRKLRVFNCDSYEFVIVKGFKITHYFPTDTYTVQDVRFNDFYSEVSEEDLSILTLHGFLKGIDIISYKRNIKRVGNYHRLIEGLYSKITQGEKEGKDNYPKQLRVYNNRIHSHHDLLQLYKSKIKEYETNEKLTK